MDSLFECVKKQRYEKSKLLELRKNMKCQEWPKVLNKKFIGIDGKWDPVGAFENSYPQRTRCRDDIDHFYNERYRKRQRDDFKYYYYDDGSKRYSSYGSRYPQSYTANSKQKYQYDDEFFDDCSKNRVSPSEYYSHYSYQAPKYRNTIDEHAQESMVVDTKPEWFTGGPNNINETIELSGMSLELEAGILRNRKFSKNEENYSQLSKLSPKEDSKIAYSTLHKDEMNNLDSHLMTIIKNNVKEKDKRKNVSTAKEVEKVLKSILLRPNEECQEVSSISQSTNGIVRTVNEIEADLKLKGNRGAGDMSAYYKLLGLVQNGTENCINNQETSTNNNHPRQLNQNCPIVNQIKTENTPPLVMDMENVCQTKHDIIDCEVKEIISKSDNKSDSVKLNKSCSDNFVPKIDEINPVDLKKVNGFNNYNNLNSSNTSFRNERITMAPRNICNPLSSHFSNHMLGNGQIGQNAYRWIRAMNNAAAASARIIQINQQDYCTSPENNNLVTDSKSENKQENENDNQILDSNSMDSFNQNLDSNIRANLEQSHGGNHMNNYFNSLNVNNYMSPGSSLFNQLSMKQFLPFGYHPQSSMFGRQFLNPYLLQQLFVHKQWENRNLCLQNQLRQFQSMNFNNTVTDTNFSSCPESSLPILEGDCLAVNVTK